MFVHQFDRQTRTHRCTQGVLVLKKFYDLFIIFKILIYKVLGKGKEAEEEEEEKETEEKEEGEEEKRCR